MRMKRIGVEVATTILKNIITKINNSSQKNISTDELYDMIMEEFPKRKVSEEPFFVKGHRNPCGCSSNVYHYEYDGEDIIGVCNACGKDVYIVRDEYKEETLKLFKE